MIRPLYNKHIYNAEAYSLVCAAMQMMMEIDDHHSKRVTGPIPVANDNL
jgi:hypothetical protein